MKVIKINHTNKGLLTFNKGGSTLLTHTIKNYCDWKGYEVSPNWESIEDMIVISRNPVDRFYSQFFHWIGWERRNYTEWNERECDIYFGKLERYLQQCESGEIESGGDMHYIRMGEVLRSFGWEDRHWKRYRIEDITAEIHDAIRWEKASDNVNWKSVHEKVDSDTFNQRVPLLQDLGIPPIGWDSTIFGGMWKITEWNLKEHHKGEGTAFRLRVRAYRVDLEARIEKWVREDLKAFGYGKP